MVECGGGIRPKPDLGGSVGALVPPRALRASWCGPGRRKGRFGKKCVLSQITIFTVFGPPRGWLLGLNWLQIGARPGLDIPKGKLSARGRPWGPQVPRWGPLKTAIIPKITPKVGCNSTSKTHASSYLTTAPRTDHPSMHPKTCRLLCSCRHHFFA